MTDAVRVQGGVQRQTATSSPRADVAGTVRQPSQIAEGNLSSATPMTIQDGGTGVHGQLPALGQPPQLYPVNRELAQKAVAVDGPPTDWSVVLQRFTQAVRDNGLEGALSELKLLKTDIQQSSDARLQKIQQWVDKMSQVAQQEKTSSIWGWIKKAFNFVVSLAAAALAVAAAVATGGAATVVAVLAVVQVVGSIIDMVDYGREQAGLPPTGWPTSIGDGLSKGLKKLGAGEWAEYVGMATDLAIAAASFSAGGAAKLGGAMNGLVTGTRITEVVGALGAGAATLGLGASESKTGKLQNSADLLEADKEALTSTSKRRNARTQELNDFIAEAGEETDKLYREVVTILESEIETLNAITGSIRPARQTV
ncbi:MAG: hypothetical protein RI906_3432 [Pseudomonadota bacterium]|jgi:hypothetical protein